MNGLEKKQAAPDMKAVGINLFTAGFLSALLDGNATPMQRALYAGFGAAGVVVFAVGKRWE